MNSYGKPSRDGIPLKKKYGQHFLTDEGILKRIVSSVEITSNTSIFEIGGGQGALTRTILQSPCKQLHVFEIDEDWATYLKQHIKDPRLTVRLENILDTPRAFFESSAPWVLLANLPYQVTFPILRMLQRNRDLLQEGTIMVQEEVAQRIVGTKGRDYGYVSLFFQWYFEWKLLEKISPAAFYPPPKVYSRLLHFKPRQNIPPIKDEEKFWTLIRIAFKQPRRTLKNNLQTLHYDLSVLSPELLALRAQQVNMEQFLTLWHQLTDTAK